jgi:type II secretory pathway component GspD/PulD (secretin)
MSRFTVGRIACCLAILSSVGLYAVWGQDPSRPSAGGQPAAKGDDTPKNKRLVILLRHGSAKDLAATLAKHFKGDAEVQAEPASNCLLINAAPSVADEVVKVVQQLDRPQQLVSVEVLLAEFALKKGEGGKLEVPDKDLDEKEFSGPVKDVLAKLEALQKKGQIAALKRIQMTALEEQSVSARAQENKPMVTGVAVTGTGRVSRNITYRATGTVVTVTPRVAPDKRILLDLEVQDARLHVPEDGIPIGTDENGQPVKATEVVQASVKGNLAVPSGQAVAATGVKTTSKSGQAQTLVIVTARLLEPDGQKDKE